MAKKKGEKRLTREGAPMYMSLSARAGFSRSVSTSVQRTRTGATSVHTNEMPHFSEAPAGARVIDNSGAYAVCLATANGMLLGFYRR